MLKIFPFILAASILLLTQASCRKLNDFIRDHPDVHDTLCRITQMNLSGLTGRPDTFDVLYNAKGNPTDILERSLNIFGIDNIEHHFRYDKFGRLLYYFINYSPQPGSGTPNATGGLIFHKYDYPRKNFVTDTVIMYTPGYPPMYDSAFDANIKGYTLDEKGRIIKLWTVFRDPHKLPELAGDIVYDANGNLPLSNPELVYDTKVNVYRTSKIFQFVFNDFSRNNPINTTIPSPISYNEFGLPLILPKSDHYYGSLFDFANSGASMNFVYACSMPRGPINY
jgi:hypothetical protein